MQTCSENLNEITNRDEKPFFVFRFFIALCVVWFKKNIKRNVWFRLIHPPIGGGLLNQTFNITLFGLKIFGLKSSY